MNKKCYWCDNGICARSKFRLNYGLECTKGKECLNYISKSHAKKLLYLVTVYPHFQKVIPKMIEYDLHHKDNFFSPDPTKKD